MTPQPRPVVSHLMEFLPKKKSIFQSRLSSEGVLPFVSCLLFSRSTVYPPPLQLPSPLNNTLVNVNWQMPQNTELSLNGSILLDIEDLIAEPTTSAQDKLEVG